MVELDEAGSASNCGKPAKIKTGWASVGKEIAAPIVKLAKDQSPETCAANCARLASIRIRWASKAKGIAADIARLAEAANLDDGAS